MTINAQNLANEIKNVSRKQLEQSINALVGESKGLWLRGTKMVYMLILHAEQNDKDVSLMQKLVQSMEDSNSHKTLLTCIKRAFRDGYGVKMAKSEDGKYKFSIDKEKYGDTETRDGIMANLASEEGLKSLIIKPAKSEKSARKKGVNSRYMIYADEIEQGCKALIEKGVALDEAEEIEKEFEELHARVRLLLYRNNFNKLIARFTKAEIDLLAVQPEESEVDLLASENDESKAA